MKSRTIPNMRSAASKCEGADGPATLLQRYRSAARDFVRAWGRPRKLDRSENLRVFESLATLAALAAIVVLGAWYDAELTRWAAQVSPGIIGFFGQITHLGASGYVFALTVLVTLGALGLRYTGLGRRRDAALTTLAARGFYLFCVAATSGLASLILKHLFGRARPKLIDIVGPQYFESFVLDASYASFPSGHAVTAVGMAVAVGFVAPRWRWPLLGVAALVMASRVIIGAHYLSDVLAGACLGYAAAVLVRRAFAARNIGFRAFQGQIELRGAGLLKAGLVKKLLMPRVAR